MHLFARRGAGNLAGADQLGQMLVHRMHAQAAPCLHHGVHLVGLALPDQVGDGGGGHQHLCGHHAAAAPGALHECLADHALQHASEL